jgi:flagellar protein FlgJ
MPSVASRIADASAVRSVVPTASTDIMGGITDPAALDARAKAVSRGPGISDPYNTALSAVTNYAETPTGAVDPALNKALNTAVLKKESLFNMTGATPPKQALLDKIAPHALMASSLAGLDVRTLLGQAMTESAQPKNVSGISKLTSNYNNLFGMKAPKSWTGNVVNLPTKEVVNGQTVTVKQPFKAYASPEASVYDYARLMGTPRYATPLAGKTTVADQIAAIRNAGYATHAPKAYVDMAVNNASKLKTGGLPSAIGALASNVPTPQAKPDTIRPAGVTTVAPARTPAGLAPSLASMQKALGLSKTPAGTAPSLASMQKSLGLSAPAAPKEVAEVKETYEQAKARMLADFEKSMTSPTGVKTPANAQITAPTMKAIAKASKTFAAFNNMVTGKLAAKALTKEVLKASKSVAAKISAFQKDALTRTATAKSMQAAMAASKAKEATVTPTSSTENRTPAGTAPSLASMQKSLGLNKAVAAKTPAGTAPSLSSMRQALGLSAPKSPLGADPSGVIQAAMSRTPSFTGAYTSPATRVAAATDLSKATDLQIRDMVNNPDILGEINTQRAAVGLDTYDIVNGKVVASNSDLQAEADRVAGLLGTPEQQEQDLFSPPKATTLPQKAAVVTAQVATKIPYVAVGNVLVKLVTGKTITQTIKDDQAYLNSLSPSAYKAEMARRKADQARRMARQEGGGGGRTSPTDITSSSGSKTAVVTPGVPKFDKYGYLS